MTRVLEINAGTVPHPLSRYHVEALEAREPAHLQNVLFMLLILLASTPSGVGLLYIWPMQFPSTLSSKLKRRLGRATRVAMPPAPEALSPLCSWNA